MPERRGPIGQEIESGAIRTDPTGVRAWSRNDQSGSEEIGRASSNGARSIGRCDAAGAQEGVATETKARASEDVYRWDFGSGSASAEEAAAHGAPDLHSDPTRNADRTDR